MIRIKTGIIGTEETRELEIEKVAYIIYYGNWYLVSEDKEKNLFLIFKRYTWDDDTSVPPSIRKKLTKKFIRKMLGEEEVVSEYMSREAINSNSEYGPYNLDFLEILRKATKNLYEI